MTKLSLQPRHIEIAPLRAACPSGFVVAPGGLIKAHIRRQSAYGPGYAPGYIP